MLDLPRTSEEIRGIVNVTIGYVNADFLSVRPVAFMPYRVNGQYIMEGLAASFMFTLGGLGFIILDRTNNPLQPKLNRTLMIGVGLACVLISFFTCRMFMRMKLPGYMSG